MLSSGRKNNNSPTARIHRNRTSSISSATTSKDWEYRGGNKQQRSKLCTNIKQKLNAENIGYIEDVEEMARRKFSNPVTVFFLPPAFIPESAAEKEQLRIRNQLMHDEDKKSGKRTGNITPISSQSTFRRVPQHAIHSFPRHSPLN